MASTERMSSGMAQKEEKKRLYLTCCFFHRLFILFYYHYYAVKTTGCSQPAQAAGNGKWILKRHVDRSYSGIARA